ncbi:MAG: LLM class flavin-dependent oxidoreductase [Acidimicrobiales bacterium]
MRTAIGIGGAASGREDWQQQVDLVREAEALGVDQVWSAEAWGQDCLTTLAYLAALTERIRLGTGIMQVSARAPSMAAMSAMTLSTISDGRFILGLGVSGPQVVEGLIGQPFARPLERLREYVDVLRLAFAGEKLVYNGNQYVLPRPGGEGKALRLAQPPDDRIPIYLATLGPKALELTGARADGWVGTSFVPEAGDALLAPIAAGAASAGRSIADLDIQAGGAVRFGDDLDELLTPHRAGTAFSLGAMGSPSTNFYNDAYRRAGFEEAAIEVQRLWVEHRRDEAIAAVPDELVLQTNFLGDDEQVRARIRAYRDAGVTTLRLAPTGRTLDERVATLGRVMDLVRQVDGETTSDTSPSADADATKGAAS